VAQGRLLWHNAGQRGATLTKVAQGHPMWQKAGQRGATLTKVAQGWPKCVRIHIGKLTACVI